MPNWLSKDWLLARAVLLNLIFGLPAAYDIFEQAAAVFVPAAQQYDLMTYVPDGLKGAYVAALVGLNIVIHLHAQKKAAS
jgi:hypothetical protein